MSFLWKAISRTPNPSNRWIVRQNKLSHRAYCKPTSPQPDIHSKLSSKLLFKQEVFDERCKFFNEYVERFGSENAYPPFCESMSVPDFIESFKHLDTGNKLPNECILSGRIMSKRQASKKLIFYVIKNLNENLQVMCSVNTVLETEVENFHFIHRNLKRGDIISIRGTPYRSKSNELTIEAKEVKLLSPCLHDFPDYNGITDKELRYRNRHVDLMITSGVRDLFMKRSQIIRSLRQFLENRGFIEVETPMLTQYAGGAAAKPFETHLNAMKTDLYLRIAPELYLKQLVIGGMDRVFEIGKSFRNEGTDNTHNPEFTMCEFYQAYADYNQLMNTTQEILQYIVTQNFRTSKITIDVPAKGNYKAISNVEIDFSKPFQRIDVMEYLEQAIGMPLPDVNNPENTSAYLEIVKKFGIECSAPLTTVRLLDALVEHFIESQCIQPTFLCNIPIAISPLARQHRSLPGVTERFELFIGRMELCNAYSELNDPQEQRLRFKNQIPDGESIPMNDDWYCNTLEWGLPPTGGWGIGIDRLVMILTNNFSIKEVTLYPFMKKE